MGCLFTAGSERRSSLAIYLRKLHPRSTYGSSALHYCGLNAPCRFFRGRSRRHFGCPHFRAWIRSLVPGASRADDNAGGDRPTGGSHTRGSGGHRLHGRTCHDQVRCGNRSGSWGGGSGPPRSSLEVRSVGAAGEGSGSACRRRRSGIAGRKPSRWLDLQFRAATQRGRQQRRGRERDTVSFLWRQR